MGLSERAWRGGGVVGESGVAGGFPGLGMTQESPVSTVSLSTVSVTSGQPQSENVKWKIPEINTSYFKLHAILCRVVTSRRVPLHPSWDVNHCFVQRTLLYMLLARQPCGSHQAIRGQVPCSKVLDRQHNIHSFHYSAWPSLLDVIISVANLSLCLIYKLHFILAMCVQKKA